MANAGSLFINISANSAKLTTDFSKAAGAVSGFGSKIASIGSALTGFWGQIAGIAGAAGIGLLINNTFHAIDATKTLAGTVGITTDALTRLQYAAQLNDSSAEAMANGLKKMNQILGGTDDESDKAAKVLSQLGLSFENLKNQSPDEAFLAIADAFSSVQNAGDRAAISVALFGKSGQDMINIMAGGADGIRKAAAEADRLGLTLSQVDANKVDAANDALTRVKSLMQGALNKAVVDLAPILEFVSNKFVDFVTAGEGLGPKVAAGFEMVAKAVGYVSEYVGYLKFLWHSVKIGFLVGISAIVTSLEVLGKGFVAVTNLLPGVKMEFSSAFSAVAQGLRDDVAAQLTNVGQSMDELFSGKRSREVSEFFDGIKAASTAAANAGGNAFKGDGKTSATKASKEHASAVEQLNQKLNEQILAITHSSQWMELYKLKTQGATQAEIENAAALQRTINMMEDQKAFDDFTAKLTDQIDTFGMSAAQIELYHMALKGLTGAEVMQATALIDQLSAMEEHNKLMEEGRSLTEELRSPMDKYLATLVHLDELLDAGAIGWDTYNAAVERANASLDGNATAQADANKARPIQSNAAREFRFGSGMPGNLGSLGQDKQVDDTKKIARNSNEQVRLLRDIDRNTKVESFEGL